MSLHEDLLQTAEDLAKLDQTRPKQANLRRALSTAYYALFHLLVSEAAYTLVPGDNGPLQSLVARALNHSDMRDVCKAYASNNLPQELKNIGAPNSAGLMAVARAFVRLQEQRHSADYDRSHRISRADAAIALKEAQAAFAHWKLLSKEDVRAFLVALALRKQWKRG